MANETRVCRPLVEADIGSLETLWRQARLVDEHHDVAAEVAAVLSRHSDLCFAVEVEERVVGSVLGIDVGWGGLASRLVVASDFRRQGVARLLVAALEDGLRELGKPGCAVIMLAENETARSFWHDMDYEPVPGLFNAWHGWSLPSI